MKLFYRILSLVLCMVMVFGIMGCDRSAQSTTTSPQDDASILAARRDAAEAYMRAMATYLWRAEEDITYTRSSDVLTDKQLAAYPASQSFQIKAGRLYRGVPYSYAGASAWNFMDYGSEADAKGIHAVSGLHWRALNGGSSIGARVGSDCSGAIQLAWNYIGGTHILATTQYMVEHRGYLPVGNYNSSKTINSSTDQVCEGNGEQTMAAAYAQLQKADGVVMRVGSSGHTMMVVDVNVVYNDDGTIDTTRSYATFLHQTGRYLQNETRTYDETLGEYVYTTFGIDDKLTFRQLYHEGYLPITVEALIDVDAAEDPWVQDTQTEYTKDTILKGKFRSNRIISSVEITITDSSGNVVMQASCYNPRQTNQTVFTFDMQVRFNQELEYVRWGSLDLDNLPAGTYHCTHVLRDAHGAEYTMRDFDFSC